MDGAPTFIYGGTAPSISGFNQWETLVDVDGPVLLHELYFNGTLQVTLNQYLKVVFSEDDYFAYHIQRGSGDYWSVIEINTDADNSTSSSYLGSIPLGEHDFDGNGSNGKEYAFYGPIYCPDGLKILYATGQTSNIGTGDLGKLTLRARYELIGG